MLHLSNKGNLIQGGKDPVNARDGNKAHTDRNDFVNYQVSTAPLEVNLWDSQPKIRIEAFWMRGESSRITRSPAAFN